MGRPVNGVSHHIGIPHKELRSLRLIQNCRGKDGPKQNGRVLEIQTPLMILPLQFLGQCSKSSFNVDYNGAENRITFFLRGSMIEMLWLQ
jgi:hypothetical protein